MSPALVFVFILLVVYQLKHFLADFPLQGVYMLGKFKPGWDFIPPLTAHCIVHAWFTIMIVLVLTIAISPNFASLSWLAAVDFVAHFVMDRIKAGPRYLDRFHDKQKFSFWYCVGLDQMVHHLTHYFIIFQLTQHYVRGYL